MYMYIYIYIYIMCLCMYCVYVCMCIYSYILPSFNWWQFFGEVFKYLTSTKLMK